MKILVVEDDFITRKILKKILGAYGEVDIAVNGVEGFEAFKMAFDEDERYTVIFLDVNMPQMNGQELLKNIRKFENDNDIWGEDSAKIIMATALSDFENIKTAFREQCEAYIVKPVEKDKIQKALLKLGLISI